VTEVITFPDVEFHAIQYLTPYLSGVLVDNTVPKPRPKKLVRVLRTGGPRLTLVTEEAQITYDCWAPKVEEAQDLAQMVRGLLWVMPDRYTTATTYRVHDLGGPTNQPDPDTGLPRYTGTVLILTRGVAVA
jgi:hypothetical protein